MSGPCSADSLVLPAVQATLRALELADEDVAAARLAEAYARQVDDAHWVEVAADRILRKVQKDPDDDGDLFAEVQALRNKVAAQAVLAMLGPKLHDVLTSLGATPKARASLPRGGAARGTSKLATFNAKRTA